MKPAAFDMLRPETLEEALRVLAANGEDAKLLAGGQSLVPTMNFRLAAPKVLIDLNRVLALSGVRRDGDWLRVGAMTRQAELLENPLVAAHAPLLAQALAHVGHLQTRSRGTIGGSIVHADPSAELPLVMTVLDAMFTIERTGQRRTAKAGDFFVDALVTGIDADEILTEIAIPLAPEGARCEFREYSRRHGDFAIVAVACQYALPAFAIGIGGLEAVPRRCCTLEAALAQRKTEPQELLELIHAELAVTHPLSDLQAGGDYRRQLAAVLVADVLAEVLGA
jgi:2-furoyl-CoA dehydrogenase FAD binding subunit